MKALATFSNNPRVLSVVFLLTTHLKSSKVKKLCLLLNTSFLENVYLSRGAFIGKILIWLRWCNAVKQSIK